MRKRHNGGHALDAGPGIHDPACVSPGHSIKLPAARVAPGQTAGKEAANTEGWKIVIYLTQSGAAMYIQTLGVALVLFALVIRSTEGRKKK